MKVNEDGMLLRIYIGEADRFGGRPLHEAILRKAREMGMAGATVFRGAEGFGANSVVHRARLLELSPDLPIVIEVVDTHAKIERLAAELDPMIKGGLATLEPVRILVYRHDPNGGMKA